MGGCADISGNMHGVGDGRFSFEVISLLLLVDKVGAKVRRF